jgi:Tfp pilus assembly protein PilF
MQCHQEETCKASPTARQKEQDNCVSCHMPKGATGVSEHVVYTDHSIPRTVLKQHTNSSADRKLVSFWNDKPSERDLAMGYAVVAGTEPSYRAEALELLRAAVRLNPKDAPAAMQLAQFYDRMRQTAAAKPLYDRVLKLDPVNTAALTNRGSLHAQEGETADAMRLWSKALILDPALTTARLNLAVGQFRSGDRKAAIESLKEALRFDPDHSAARKMLAEMGH